MWINMNDRTSKINRKWSIGVDLKIKYERKPFKNINIEEKYLKFKKQLWILKVWSIFIKFKRNVWLVHLPTELRWRWKTEFSSSLLCKIPVI